MFKLTVLPIVLLPLVLAAFTTQDKACWRRNCVVRTDAGTLCFQPQENGVYQGECTDIFLKNLTQVHLDSNVGRSIVYYDDKTRLLGAATWPVPPSMKDPIFVCMSGRRLDYPKKYRTICRHAYGDDDMHFAAVHTTECVVDKKPRFNYDGCFNLGGNHKDDDDKNFWEQPVVGGIFWALGALVTVAAIGRWGRKAVQKVRESFPRSVNLLVGVFDFSVSRWRTPRTQLSARSGPCEVERLPQFIAGYVCERLPLPQAPTLTAIPLSLPARPVNASLLVFFFFFPFLFLPIQISIRTWLTDPPFSPQQVRRALAPARSHGGPTNPSHVEACDAPRIVHSSQIYITFCFTNWTRYSWCDQIPKLVPDLRTPGVQSGSQFHLLTACMFTSAIHRAKPSLNKVQ